MSTNIPDDIMEKFFDLSIDLTAIANLEGYFLKLNSLWSELLGFSNEELTSVPFIEFVHPDDKERTMAEAAAFFSDGHQTIMFQNRYMTKSGDYIWLAWNARKHNDLLVCVAKDITEIKQKEQEIQNERDFFQSVFDNMLEGFVIQANDGSIIGHNQAALEILGLSADQIYGRTSFDPRWRSIREDGSDFPGNEHPAMVALETQRPVKDAIMGVHKPSGDLRWILINSQPIFDGETSPQRVVTTFQDITEAREQRRVAFQQAKLASIGELAAGVGHEINNPLAIVEGYLTKIERSLNKEKIDVESIQSCVEKMRLSTSRIATIVNGLRAFAREDEFQFEVLDLAEQVRQTVGLLEELYTREGIMLDFSIPDSPCYIQGNSGQLNQVIMNLVSNARDAVKAETKKTIAVVLKPVDSQYVLEVRDNGPGIPNDIQDRIFDAFFTTKEVGKGTGIGLSITNSIVQEHNGIVDFESSDNGTKFRVFFNIVGQPARSLDKDPEQPFESGNGISILLVEDEIELRELLREELEEFGCSVVEADDGQQALKIVQNKSFDLVLTDIRMPGMDGSELVRRLEDMMGSRCPELAFMTGGTTDPEMIVTEANLKAKVPQVIFKPFRDGVVEKLIAQVLKQKYPAA